MMASVLFLAAQGLIAAVSNAAEFSGTRSGKPREPAFWPADR